MKLLIRTVWADVRRDPVRALLTVLGIAVGVAIVTLTINVGTSLRAANSAGFATPGSRMIVATAERDGTDGLRYRSDILTMADMESIRRLVPGVKAITPVSGLRVTPQSGVDFSSIVAGDTRYRTRSVSAVGEDYPVVYDLHIVAGSFFTSLDLDQGRQVVVLAESAAHALFGSAEAAVGKKIGATRKPDDQRVDYEVVGVYRDVPGSLRQRYDIADILVSLALPPSRLDAFAVLVDGLAPGAAAARLEAAVRSLHGPQTAVLAWQGNRWSYGDPDSRESAEIRSVVLFLDGFGALALIISSTGILTMMMVSVVDRSRSIGLRRALGSRRAGIAGWFVGEAVLLAGVGSLLGIAAAALFIGQAMNALAPILPGPDGGAAAIASVLRLGSIAAGVGSALVAGTLFSLPPAVMAARVQPAEAMRES